MGCSTSPYGCEGEMHDNSWLLSRFIQLCEFNVIDLAKKSYRATDIKP